MASYYSWQDLDLVDHGLVARLGQRGPHEAGISRGSMTSALNALAIGIAGITDEYGLTVWILQATVSLVSN